MLCGSDKCARVVQLNPSTLHTVMVHTMHTGTSKQNVYFLPVEHSELVRKLASTLLGLVSRNAGYIEGVLFQSTPRVQAGWLTHPPKCSLTDAQMIGKRRMN